MEGDQIIEKRQKKVINWLKDPTNFSLTAVMLFAIGIRFYYFFLVGNQPLWWDEAVYGSLAKNMISHLWDGSDLIIGETHIRPILLPFLWSILMRFHIPEGGARFILELIPSMLSVFFVYLVGKEVFNKRVGIIAAFIFSVTWVHLFYSVRMLTNLPSALFVLMSVYYFIKTNKSNFNLTYFALSLFLLSLATLIRYPNGIIFFAYFAVLVLSRKLYLNKTKFWTASIIGIAPILIFFIANFILFGNIFPALLGGDYLGVSDGEKVEYPIAFDLVKFFPILLQKTFFVFFLLGVFLILFELIVGYNFILKNKKLMNYVLLVFILIFTFSFYIFYLRYTDDRYLIPILFTMVLPAACGLDFVFKLIRKYNKYFAFILILAVLLFGAYYQMQHADGLIKNKAQSFLQVRQGFEWIRDNTPEDSTIIGRGIEPYTVYYAERQYLSIPRNESEASMIEQADYAVLHAFTNQDAYYAPYLQENNWTPINGFFFDQQQTQPALIIYKKN